MDLKTKLLLNLMSDNNYFTDLNSYLREMVEQNKLTYNHLKYLYSKMYINKSLFIRQNIFPVSQFLMKGYYTKEAEKLAKLLPDAYEKTIFCYDKNEKGKLFNKLFTDLEFVYMQYDYYIKSEYSKEDAFELVKSDIELTNIKQREVEVEIKNNELDTKQKLEEAFNKINEQRMKIRDEFEKEVFPYNEKQIEMIDRYNRLQETLDKLEYYAEFSFEDTEEFE